jgi:hypothetical protein
MGDGKLQPDFCRVVGEVKRPFKKVKIIKQNCNIDINKRGKSKIYAGFNDDS